MSARDHVSVRLSPVGLAGVDQIASDAGSTRSAVIRALLAEALKSDPIKARVVAKLKETA